MNKLITVGLAVFAAISVHAQNFQSRDLLGGNRAVYLTNNTTWNFGDVGVPFTNGSGGAVYSATNRYSTNGLVSPGTLYTNTATYNGAAWVDVASFSDRNGNNASASVAVAMTGTSASATGAVTFTFVELLDRDTIGGLGTPATHAQNKFIFAATPTGTTAYAIKTNLPTAQMQGTAGWRLLSVAYPNNGASGGAMLTTLQVNGYLP